MRFVDVVELQLVIADDAFKDYGNEVEAEQLCKKQLADWGIEYFDLFLMHFPISLEYVDPSVRYLPGDVTDHGETGREGPSQGHWHLQFPRLFDCRYAKIRPVTLQIENNPYLVQPDLLKFAEAEGITVTGYSSFGPLSYVELKWQKAENAPPLFENHTIVSIARKHDKSPVQIILRWATQRSLAVIPKSSDPGRLLQNLNAIAFDLTRLCRAVQRTQ
ncbi:MAG: NAD(P)H-dependent D-xylose reductase (XR) [Geoglossum simile]|nr:MAG: NAD(P)H-dependent D-xylose reductase (XR) [Geoglossum simile]